MIKRGKPFNSDGMAGSEEDQNNNLKGAKGGGLSMKHNTTEGADKGSTMPDNADEIAKKRMLMMAIMRAQAMSGQPQMGGPGAMPPQGGPV